MGHLSVPVTTKSFLNGRSTAVRIPAEFGIKPGEELVLSQGRESSNLGAMGAGVSSLPGGVRAREDPPRHQHRFPRHVGGRGRDATARQARARRGRDLGRHLCGSSKIDVLPWDRDAAAAYGDERVACEREGRILDQADLMILAHAGSTGRVLVTRDGAFLRRNRKGPFKTRVIGW